MRRREQALKSGEIRGDETKGANDPTQGKKIEFHSDQATASALWQKPRLPDG
jgi:hypothetical protein